MSLSSQLGRTKRKPEGLLSWQFGHPIFEQRRHFLVGCSFLNIPCAPKRLPARRLTRMLNDWRNTPGWKDQTANPGIGPTGDHLANVGKGGGSWPTRATRGGSSRAAFCS